MENKQDLKEYLKRYKYIMRGTFLYHFSCIIFLPSLIVLVSKLRMIANSSFTNGDIVGLVLSLAVVILIISHYIFDSVKTNKNIKKLNNEFGLGDEDGL